VFKKLFFASLLDKFWGRPLGGVSMFLRRAGVLAGGHRTANKNNTKEHMALETYNGA